jgi:hypothetical protein
LANDLAIGLLVAGKKLIVVGAVALGALLKSLLKKKDASHPA